MKATST